MTTNGNAPTTRESEDEQNKIYYLNFHINFEPKMQEDDTPQKESGDKVRARVLRMIKLVQEPKKFAEKDIRAGI